MKFLCNECGKTLDKSDFYRKVKNKRKDCLNKNSSYVESFSQKMV